MDLDISWWQIAAAVGAGCVIGATLALLVLSRLAARKLEAVNEDWQARLEEDAKERKLLKGENDSLTVTLDKERAALQQFKHAAVARSTELHSLQERVNAQSKELFSLSSERDALAEKMQLIHRSFVAARHRASELETEFGKSREFYKGQLMSAFEQRQSLERKIEDAKSEHDSLQNLLSASKSEHDSVSRMLTNAQSRLESLETLEKKLIVLEADNAELKHDIDVANRKLESAGRNSDEAEALKAQNRELAQCLESMEDSRKQYEQDAQRYREQYEQSESESETLRVKLSDIHERLADMQEQQAATRESVSKHDASLPLEAVPADGEGDDLTEIVGIGKVFEAMLHRLGIFYFRQIAAFGPTELARVNAELKEFKGRIEHDDWIGQAKELHFKKYGSAGQDSTLVSH